MPYRWEANWPPTRAQWANLLVINDQISCLHAVARLDKRLIRVLGERERRERERVRVRVRVRVRGSVGVRRNCRIQLLNLNRPEQVMASC